MADFLDDQQFQSADDARDQPQPRAAADEPERNTAPERITGAQICNVGGHYGDQEGNGKRHHHGMDGMARNGNGGARAQGQGVSEFLHGGFLFQCNERGAPSRATPVPR